VKVVDDAVLLYLPPQDQLDAILGTDLHCVTSCREMELESHAT
jgi:hypothetical protein